MPFIVSGPGVPKGRIDHSLISAVDYFPTISALSGIPIPEGTVLRGGNIADIWHGKINHLTQRAKPLFWRGGGGPPPCWNRSPGLAVRNGDWKLLFSPNDGATPQRVELYNMSVNALASDHMNGAFFEAQNEAKHFPEVVEKMVSEIMPWHRGTPIPFGAPRNTAHDHPRFQPGGCEAYPFPGSRRAPGPDADTAVRSVEAGGDEAASATRALNLATRRAQQPEPLATPEALAMHHARARGGATPSWPAGAPQASGGHHVAELEAEVAALQAELAELRAGK